MSVREILRWPDPSLARRCVPIQNVTPEIERLAADMLETMYAAKGRGLAAPQVGELLRLFVMDETWKTGPRSPQVFINATITAQSSQEVINTESCLSIPGVTAELSRPDWVDVTWTGLDGSEQAARFVDFAAVCVQHETDHLDGIVTFDRLAPDLREIALRAYAEATA